MQYIGNSAFFRLDDAWHGTKNTITNYSPIRLTERYINPYFTDVIWKNSSNDPSSFYREETSALILPAVPARTGSYSRLRAVTVVQATQVD